MDANQAVGQIIVEPPGTVLRDLHILLELLCADGIEAGSGDVPAMKALASINERLTEPISINFQRPQFRTYPNIQALFLLLRTAGLLQAHGKGASRTLVADDTVAESFCKLNPVEQFGSMLDAWLMKAEFSTIGIKRGWPSDFLQGVVYCWKKVGTNGVTFTRDERASQDSTFRSEVDRVSLWLLFGFGMIDFKQGQPIAGKSWHPAAVRQTPFGRIVLHTLSQAESVPLYKRSAIAQEIFGTTLRIPFRKLINSVDADKSPSLREGVSFDALRSAFQPLWPAWKRSLALAPPDFHEGTFVFKVSLNHVWSRIAIPAVCDMTDLSDAILDSVDFDEEDHLWVFELQDARGRDVSVVHPFMDESDGYHRGNSVRVGELPLPVGGSMSYRFDFGDNWRFKLILERVDKTNTDLKIPQVLESHGEPPGQYEGWLE